MRCCSFRIKGDEGSKIKCFNISVVLHVILQIIGVIVLFTVCMMTRWNSPLNLLGNPGDISNVAQIVEDWRTQPFVSLSVSDDVCPEGSEPAFSKTWGGTEFGCAHFDYDECDNGSEGYLKSRGGRGFSSRDCRIPRGYGYAEN